MTKVFRSSFLSFHSDNLKSKTCTELIRSIQNRKLVGIVALLVLLVGYVGLAHAQQPKKVPRIGLLRSGWPADPNVEAFRQGLRELGYIEGKNIAIEYRHAEGKDDRIPDLAAELVRLKVDIIVVGGGTATSAAKKATSTIPIVITSASDPVGAGLVASLAKPGGNITGSTLISPELSGKRLELLKEAVPGVSRMGVLISTANPAYALLLKETEAAAQSLGLQLQILEVRGSNELESAFGVAKRGRSEAMNVLSSALFSSWRKDIVDLAARNRLPAVYYDRLFPEAGGLMSYGPNLADLYRRAATFVDKILKGAKPADLPVEQPTKFEFIINLKAAKQIGLTIPQAVLYRADKVIK